MTRRRRKDAVLLPLLLGVAAVALVAWLVWRALSVRHTGRNPDGAPISRSVPTPTQKGEHFTTKERRQLEDLLTHKTDGRRR